jgi:hypothetical protein
MLKFIYENNKNSIKTANTWQILNLPVVLQGQIINKMNVSNKLLGSSLTMEVVDLNEKVKSEVILATNIGVNIKKISNDNSDDKSFFEKNKNNDMLKQKISITAYIPNEILKLSSKKVFLKSSREKRKLYYTNLLNKYSTNINNKATIDSNKTNKNTIFLNNTITSESNNINNNNNNNNNTANNNNYNNINNNNNNNNNTATNNNYIIILILIIFILKIMHKNTSNLRTVETK